MPITQEQSMALAVAIYKDIKPFVKAHWNEYQLWLKDNGYPYEEINYERQNAAVYIALKIKMSVGGWHIFGAIIIPYHYIKGGLILNIQKINTNESNLETQLNELVNSENLFDLCIQNKRIALAACSYYFGAYYAYMILRSGHSANFFSDDDDNPRSAVSAAKKMEEFAHDWDEQKYPPLRESCDIENFSHFAFTTMDSFIYKTLTQNLYQAKDEKSTLVFFCASMGYRDVGLYWEARFVNEHDSYYYQDYQYISYVYEVLCIICGNVAKVESTLPSTNFSHT